MKTPGSTPLFCCQRRATLPLLLLCLRVAASHAFVAPPLPLHHKPVIGSPQCRRPGMVTARLFSSSSRVAPVTGASRGSSHLSLRLKASAAAGGATPSSSRPPLDVQAIVRYLGATALQWGFITAFMGGAQALAGAASVKDTKVFSYLVTVFFAFMSLRSRVFSPLDASRPTVASERVKKTEQKRPSWMPPPLAFPVIWTTIGFLRTLSSSLIYRTTGTLLSTPILAMMLHLSIGDTWNNINNVERRLGTSVPGVCTVWLSMVTTVWLYYRTLPLAGLVLLPSAVWITAATALVTSIWSLNGREPLYPFKTTQTSPATTTATPEEGPAAAAAAGGEAEE